MWKVEGEVAALTVGERPPAPAGERSGAKTSRGKSACRRRAGSGCVRSPVRAERERLQLGHHGEWG